MARSESKKFKGAIGILGIPVYIVNKQRSRNSAGTTLSNCRRRQTFLRFLPLRGKLLTRLFKCTERYLCCSFGKTVFCNLGVLITQINTYATSSQFDSSIYSTSSTGKWVKNYSINRTR